MRGSSPARTLVRRRVASGGLVAVVTGLSLILTWPGTGGAAASPAQGTVVTVWVNPTATAVQVRAVRRELGHLSDVRHPCTYWDKKRNFALARKLFPGDEGAVNVRDMPTSYLCVVTPADAQHVIDTMNGRPGVDTVTVGRPDKLVGSAVHWLPG